MGTIGDARGRTIRAVASVLIDRLGPPDVGLILGTGFDPLTESLGAGESAPWPGELGLPRSSGAGVCAVSTGRRRVWVVGRRVHLYEGFDARTAAAPVEVLAAAGATAVLLTSAVGGLLDDDRPGDLAVVRDHLNLTGDDPVRRIAPEHRDPEFPDIADAYDRSWTDRIRRASGATRDGVLAAVPGPTYETPAEVRMLRALGADLASMSVVPEVVLARYLGLRVAAVACIANRGAGLGGAIRHDIVIKTVRRTVRSTASRIVEAIDPPGC